MDAGSVSAVVTASETAMADDEGTAMADSAAALLVEILPGWPPET